MPSGPNYPATHRDAAANLRDLAQMLEDGCRGCPACAEGWPVICPDCREALGRCDGFRRRADWHASQPQDEPAFVPPRRRRPTGEVRP